MCIVKVDGVKAQLGRILGARDSYRVEVITLDRYLPFILVYRERFQATGQNNWDSKPHMIVIMSGLVQTGVCMQVVL